MRRAHLALTLLLVLTAGIYWQVGEHAFIEFDDDRYVYQNPMVLEGLSVEGLGWAFTATKASNWQPVTWLSHMLDVQLFGPGPGAHHLSNLLLHLLNVLGLFLILDRMTHAHWRSAFVAALFAVHPLHVESVAWISERKDLLSTFFWWLSIWLYLDYVRLGRRSHFLGVILAFVLGLMAKSMLVTLPFTLLLLDYWPLGRLELSLASLWKRTREKLPLFGLTLAFSVIAVLTQSSGQALMGTDRFSIGIRVANALNAYAGYVLKMIWPQPLAAYYPYPIEIELLPTLAAATFLVVLSVAAIRLARSHPYLLMGWCWYLGTLVPVIGIVQVGTQSMADRYSYVPLVGLFIAIAWVVPALLPGRERVLAVLAGAAVLGLAAVTFVEAARWRDTVTLFRHTLEVTTRNPMAHGILASALAGRGELDQATAHFRRALELKPDMPQAHTNLGNALFSRGEVDEAIQHYRAAVNAAPDHYSAHNNLGSVLYSQRRYDEAIYHLREALRIQPASAEAHNNLGNVLDAMGSPHEAIEHYRESLRLQPGNASAHYNLGETLLAQQALDPAIEQFRLATRLRRDYVRAHRGLAVALVRAGRASEAEVELETVLRLAPGDPKARSLLQQIRSATR